jgi:predicted DNA-binding transcriptional regulator AlpA
MSLNDHQTKKLLHSRDAAEILGVSEAWLARHRWAGTGPVYVRVGGDAGRAVRYLRADLDAWISGHRVDALQAGRHAR